MKNLLDPLTTPMITPYWGGSVFFSSGFCVGKLNLPIEIDVNVSEIPLIVDKSFIGTSFKVFKEDPVWATLTAIVVFETVDEVDKIAADVEIDDEIGFAIVFDEKVPDFDVDDLNLMVELKLAVADFFIDNFDEELDPI